MNSKQLLSKVSVLTLVGATILGSGSSLYAKTYTRVVRNRITVSVKPWCGNTGSGNTGSGNTGLGNTGSGNTGSGNTGSGNTGSGNTGSGNTGSGNTGSGNTGSGNTGSGNTGSGNTGSGNTGSGNTGSGNTGSGNTGSGNTGSENNSTTASSQTQFENKVLELVNAERAKYNLSALKMDESVRKVARVKSSDMSKNNYFSHTSPTYGTPFNMLKTYGISYSSAAENIAQGYTTPEAVVKGWMNSSGHRANILNSKYTKIGIGYEANGNYWTQMFIG